MKHCDRVRIKTGEFQGLHGTFSRKIKQSSEIWIDGVKEPKIIKTGRIENIDLSKRIVPKAFNVGDIVTTKDKKIGIVENYDLDWKYRYIYKISLELCTKSTITKTIKEQDLKLA